MYAMNGMHRWADHRDSAADPHGILSPAPNSVTLRAVPIRYQDNTPEPPLDRT